MEMDELKNINIDDLNIQPEFLERDNEKAFSFEKVSFDEYLRSWKQLYWINRNGITIEDFSDIIKEYYDNIKLPTRATEYSAGWDFYSPFNLHFEMGTNIIIPTGIRFITYECFKDLVLLLYPRSGLSTKYGIKLVNTTGIIDSDYYKSSNEGHIMVNLQMNGIYEPSRMEFMKNDYNERRIRWVSESIYKHASCTIDEGERFCQGIVTQYFTDGTDVTAQRDGGFGSTGK